MAHWARR